MQHISQQSVSQDLHHVNCVGPHPQQGHILSVCQQASQNGQRLQSPQAGLMGSHPQFHVISESGRNGVGSGVRLMNRPMIKHESEGVSLKFFGSMEYIIPFGIFMQNFFRSIKF